MKSKQNKKTRKGRFAGDRQNPIVPSLQAAPETHPVAGAANQWLTGEGEMARRIREFDWSQTPVGPIENWSPSLRMVVKIMLANRFPMILWWGSQFIQFYNDPYRPIPGDKHPESMGQPASECWSEIWHVIGPLIEAPFRGGPATWDDDIFLEIHRHGFVEECHFTIAYSPVPDETAPGGIGGVLATVHEITGKIVGERRVVVLSDLRAQSAEARTAEDACERAARTLASHPKDIPFALLYLIAPDRKHAQMAGAAGVTRGQPAAPAVISLEGIEADSALWPLKEAIATEAILTVADIDDRLGGAVPPGPWSDGPQTAVIVPVRSNKAHRLAGFLVAGVSSRLQLDQPYRDFLELVSSQVATAIASAREYEEEKRRADTLAELDRAKTAFFSNVSHEFRTPLTLMLGPVEELLGRSHTDLTPAAKGQLEVVNRNGLRLLRLVNTLLDFSRIEAGRVQAVFEPTDLAAFTTELASVFRAATERAGLGLRVDCPKLPEAVYVDRDMWEKIVLNLISNAFKFTFEGEIEVNIRAESSNAILTVRDTGVGIPAEEMPRIFERFHRVQNMRSRTHEGSGIGLAMVQELVKLHGGSIRAESRLGKGTSFIVTIPLGAKHLPPDRLDGSRSLASTAAGAAPFVEEALRWLPEAAPLEEATLPPSHHELMPIPCPPSEGDDGDGRPRIVVADDNADMRHYLARMLRERYSVQEVPDGQVALAAARRRRPDLILSDVMMPNLDGFGLVRELRTDSDLKTIPIILLSARAGEESRVEGLQEGADDYLVKPFSGRELMARVAAHLDMARLRKEASEKIYQSEEQLRTTLESIGDGFFALDGDWRFIYVNASAERILGIQRDAVLGKSHWEVFPLTLGTEIERRYRLTAGGQAQDWENFYEPWGRWFHNRCFPREGGGMSVYFQDITERKQEEEALRESRAKMKAAFASMTEAIFIADAEGRLIDFNEEFVRYHRFKDREECSRTIADCPRYLDAYFQDGTPAPPKMWAMARALRGETESDVEYMLRRKETGETWWGSYSFAPIRDEGGRIVGAVVVGREITDRKRAEAALRESEDRYHRLFDAMTEGFLLMELIRDAAETPVDFRILEANRAYESVLGCKREEAIGRTLFEQFPGLARDRFEAIAAVAQTGEPLRWRGVFKPTGRYYENFYYSPRPGQLAGIFMDITERMQTEEALRASEEKYHTLFANMAEGFALYELLDNESGQPVDWRVLEVNDAYTQHTGLRKEQIAGRRISELYPDAIAQYLPRFAAVVATQTPAVFETYAQAVHRYQHIVTFPAGGRRFACTITDITERKRAEEALRESEGRFRLALKNSPVLVAMQDINLVYRWAYNTRTRTPEEVVGKTDADLFASEGLPPILEAKRRVLQTGEVVRHAHWLTSHGQRVFLDCYYEPVRDAAGNIIGVGIAAVNLTEQKRAEEAMKQSSQELARSNQELEQFAYISAHDLQEPLRQVRAFVGMLKERHADKFDGKAAEYFSYVYDGAARMSELVRGLLEYSRVGSWEARREPIPAQAALETALSNLQASIVESHASITHDELPTVVAEPTQLAQLFQNLIGNAIKFRREGVTPEIHIGVKKGSGFRGQGSGAEREIARPPVAEPPFLPEPRTLTPDTWLFSVKDNGIGIAPEFYEKVFVIFQRLHGREKYAGTGIGLAICKKIVEQHGGKIWIESKVEQGSTFCFSLPGEVTDDG